MGLDHFRDHLLVFDFDGVLADSEVLANSVLASWVTELGLPTTLEDSYERYMGKRAPEVIAAIETELGRKLPDNSADLYQARTLDRFRRDLQFVAGAREFLDQFANSPKCIASSSSPERLNVCIEILDLHDDFRANVFSANLVASGKPAPDIFLYAAEQMRTDPVNAIVIEDSPSGVAAGRAAGMTVIGLTAAGHMSATRGEALESAGAHFLAQTFDEVSNIINTALKPGS